MTILLLEPNYKNKYPPLGLMKIATFHKQLGDSVVFSKGENKLLSEQKWDRIYINSLFTFEWNATEKMIKFAYTLTKEKNIIYIGGIAATLIPDVIVASHSEINVVDGLLNSPGKLDLPNDEIIDSLPPDYSILDQIDYKYPTHDAYFTYATRGCGMNCSFCAVQKLEPQFIDYICVSDQVNNVKKQCGEKKNLMLMDNNVLKSPRLKDIIDDIIKLGFGKGEKYKNSTTGKTVKRYVDFNQGLDANFLTQEKAEQLSRIELNPVRIAFDHIQQQNKYEKAIRTCFDAGLRSFSNYLLYNTNDASWKGQSYGADTPEDLYNRLLFNVELCENLQKELNNRNIDEKVQIYSFPMRYIPLEDTKRGYIGTHWNKKILRAIQVFLTPTQGKGVSSHSFFKASFGQSLDEYLLAIYMPENILVRRGTYTPRKKDDQKTIEEKLDKSKFNSNLVTEWNQLYSLLRENRLWDNFIKVYVEDNTFSFNTLSEIQNPLEKAMYLYYIPVNKFNNNYQRLPENEKHFIRTYLKTNAKYLSELLKTD